MPDSILPHVNAISLLGKKFAIMVCVWLDVSDLQNLHGRPAVQTKSVLRYQNNELKKLALIAEIYDHIPPNFHALLQGEPKFADIVSFFFNLCVIFLILFCFFFSSEALLETFARPLFMCFASLHLTYSI